MGNGQMQSMQQQMGGNVYSGYTPYGAASSIGSPVPAASSPYASYAAAGVPHAGSPDFHNVLDSFVRSTGLAPQGSMPPDQEAAASTLSQPGVTPAFSWKRLYSFPFYFSTDSAGAGSRISIPYMKQHIRRMSSSFGSGSSSSKSDAEKAVRDANLKSLQTLRQAQEQQKLLQALQSSEMIASYLQQYLKKEDASGGENSIHEAAKRPLHYHSQPAPIPEPQVSRHRRPVYAPTAEPTISVRPTAEPMRDSSRETVQVPSYYLPQADQSALAYSHEYSPSSDLFQRMSQLDDMRRRRTSTAASENSHQSLTDQLHEQLRTRIVNDPSLLSPSSSSSSHASHQSSLSERLEQLQSLSQGLRAISPPSSLSPTPASYSSAASDEMTSEEQLSGQDSQVRPTILTYYADPSLPSMDSPASHSSSKSMAYSSDAPSKKRMKDDASTVSLSSSYSMSSHY